MWKTASPRFIAALESGFNVALRIEIWTENAGTQLFSSQLSTVPNPNLDLYILDGTVTYDKSQDIRSQFSMRLVSPNGTFIPDSGTRGDLLRPWGNEMHIYWGITFDDGSQEFVLMGMFRIARNAIEETSGAMVMTVTGYDRSRNISRNVVLSTWPQTVTQQFQINNQSWASFIQIMCTDRWPQVQFNDTAANWNLLSIDKFDGGINGTGFGIGLAATPTFSQGTDLWSEARQYAQGCCGDVYFSRDGICTYVKDPNLNNMNAAFTPDPVATFIEGSTAMFDKVSRTLDDSAAYNGCVVYGQGNVNSNAATVTSNFPINSGNPVGFDGGPGEWDNVKPAIDNDPSSPTYWYGPYGHVGHVVTSNMLVSQTQVDVYAVLMLILDLGAQESVSIPSAAANPLLEVDDVILIKRTRLGLPAEGVFYIISSITMPLTASGQMTLQVRQKRNLNMDLTSPLPTSNQVIPQNTYTYWVWPQTTAGYTDITWFLTPLTDPSPHSYFWSHQFAFGNQPTANSSGCYMGFQNHSIRPDSSVGHIAIWSVWDALAANAAPGGSAGAFSGEGVGYHAYIAYDWIPGGTYRFQVRQGPSGAGWWGGYVLDTSTGLESFVGEIQVDPSWTGILGLDDPNGNNSISFTEFFSTFPESCTAMRLAVCRWTNLTAQGGTVFPLSHTNSLQASATCTNSNVANVTGGVQHSMGTQT